MATIQVQTAGSDVWLVEVRDSGSATRHRVTARPEDRERLGGSVPAEQLIEASFEFLLEREPKESILGEFDLPVIERYFPDYPSVIRNRLDAGS